MLVRKSTAIALGLGFAIFFYALGMYITHRQGANHEARLNALRAEMVSLLEKSRADRPSGTSGRTDAVIDVPDARAALVEDLKRQLQAEMGLLPINLLKSRRDSFVELYSYDNHGASNYGTAGYLGNGYFITVKHGVMALDGDQGSSRREIVSVKLMYKGRGIKARVVDAGDANAEVDPGDWAILKVRETIDLPPLQVNLGYAYSFADPIFRLGNDYSKGIILSTGYVGQRTGNNLITCLTDGHPGVSGGGVMDQNGHLVGIPVGRMQGDYRFSFILPLREEMFRKVPDIARVEADATE